MKLVIISPYAEPEPGAATIRSHSFCQSLQETGHVAEIWAPMRPPISVDAGVRRYSGIKELMVWLWKSSANIVVGVSPPLTHNFFALVMAKVKKIPFILDAKDDRLALSPAPPDSFARWVKQRVYFGMRRWTYQNSDALLFLTEEDLELEKQRYNLRQPLILLSNGTTLDWFDLPSKSEWKKERKELRIPFEVPLLVYAGTLGDEEVIEFLNASKTVVEKNQFHVLLVLASDHSVQGQRELEAFKRKLSGLPIASRCHLVENVPYSKMGRMLGVCDIAVLPWPDDLPTSIPVKIFDYGAASLPIIAKSSNNSSVSRLFDRFEPGVHVTDWNAFVAALESLIKDGELRKRLGANARRMVEKEFIRKNNNLHLVKLVAQLNESKRF